jgi:hypothetical protein
VFITLFDGAKLSLYVKFTVVLCGRVMTTLPAKYVVDFNKLSLQISQYIKSNNDTSE